MNLMYPNLYNNPYLCIVFGYKGAAGDKLVCELNDRIAANHDRRTLPDFVFVAKQGYMICRIKAGQPAYVGGEFDNYRCVNTGSDTMACLFLILVSCLGSLRLRRLDSNDVWRQLVKDQQNSSECI